MKLGFYTYSYVDRLKMEIEPVLEAVAAAGYDGIDVSATWHDDLDPALMPPAARDRYVKTANRLGLEIEAVITHLGLAQSLRQDLPINLKGAVDVARDLGARVVTFHVGQAAERPEEAWRAVVAYLKEACDYAGRHGKLIALDGVWIASLVPTPQAALWLAADVDSPHFRHNYDPCYLAISGHDLGEASPPLLASTAHVHVKDYSGRYPDYRHLIPGEGGMDHGQYLTMLRDAGFAGYVVNECFIDAPFERACRVGYRTLAEAMRSCGVRTK
jgi:sugar phosphate isomerase/epimerase